MLYELNCAVCGKYFTNTRKNRTCGSEECKAAWHRIRCNAYEKKRAEAKKKKKTKAQNLVDIAVAARKAGMTYGQYVAQSYLRKEND